ncbi:MAG: tannase/feruloyl esterase family alpha/beta hydrolase [Terracidiphilus sp.]|jgi:feruloyl esterase
MKQIHVSENQRRQSLAGKSVHSVALRAVVILIATLTSVTLARAVPAAEPAADAKACTAFPDMDLTSIQDAPTQVLSAQIVAASDASPAFCKVDAYVYPEVSIEIHLPLSAAWNGKLIVSGNGGWAGGINGNWCDGNVKRGYACATTDTGHRGRGDDGLWAQDNLAAQVDFGYRAIHVLTLAAKSILSRYYAKDAQRSYFMSCSTGGYQGMVEAQRFPWDFDGIVAGAPDMDEADLTMREVWAQRAQLDANGKPVMDAGALAILHQGALDACDMDDGVKDGLISNPVGCSFDPSKLLCKSGETKGCLTAVQVEAAKRIYAGPPHTQERAVRGALPGSEKTWEFGSGTKYSDSFFEYMVYGINPTWTTANYDFERDYKRVGMAAIYTDTNPDLRRFKAAGGKLLVYQGGTDTVEMPTAIVDYYQTVEKVMGGQQPTQDFFRLFVIPGMNHCGGGDGATSIDYLPYLEAWVEQNHAPDKMIGAHVSDSYLQSLPEGARNVSLPLDPKIPVSFTRPMYPFPQYAKYAGGDPNDAASFRPVQP